MGGQLSGSAGAGDASPESSGRCDFERSKTSPALKDHNIARDEAAQEREA